MKAALELAAEEGLGALSARKLAARLGVQAMSLYNHVASMDALHDEMVDVMLSTLLPIQPDRKGMERAARAYLGLAVRNPQTFVLVATRLWRTVHAVQVAKTFVDGFKSAQVSERRAFRNARVLGAYLNGAGLALAAWVEDGTAHDGGGEVKRDLEVGLSSILATLLRERAP